MRSNFNFWPTWLPEILCHFLPETELANGYEKYVCVLELWNYYNIVGNLLDEILVIPMM